MGVPYVGYSNETLARLPPLKAGDLVTCPRCAEGHPVYDSAPAGLLWIKCGRSQLLAGVHGRRTLGTKVDVSGEVPW